MTTKFAISIVFRKAEVSAKFHCPTSTVTLFSGYGEGRIRSSLVKESKKSPVDSGGTIVYNYPYHVKRQGWMPTGLLFIRCTAMINPISAGGGGGGFPPPGFSSPSPQKSTDRLQTF